MPTSKPIRDRIESLKKEFDRLRSGKESLLQMIDETEIPESVYNSNAIENSTLTLRETEKILLDMEVSRDVSVREVFEAKNLARVIEYLKNNSIGKGVDQEVILFLHQMLITGINDEIAGRFRRVGEYVRVGTHIAPAPEKVQEMIESIIIEYNSQLSSYFLDRVVKFHLDFETIHPFNDGNGRIGRVIICWQLYQAGFPLIIIRDKEKQNYYQAFDDYRHNKKTKKMERAVSLALLESLHKRITYLKGDNIITLAEYSRGNNKTSSAWSNAARRQTIPAFRERGVWKISEDFKEK